MTRDHHQCNGKKKTNNNVVPSCNVRVAAGAAATAVAIENVVRNSTAATFEHKHKTTCTSASPPLWLRLWLRLWPSKYVFLFLLLALLALRGRCRLTFCAVADGAPTTKRSHTRERDVAYFEPFALFPSFCLHLLGLFLLLFVSASLFVYQQQQQTATSMLAEKVPAFFL